MARIRSVHPSLFTDEAWVSCTPLARVLYIGLMTDADDQGLFEWKPLQIRMRLLPGDNADIPSLLAELEGVNLIAQLESAGKKLGAIRYFRRFQRPKKPNRLFVLPAEWGTYVGLTDDSSEPGDDDDDAVPPKSEKLQQMEDGGGRREINPQKPPEGAFSPEFVQAWEAYPEEGRATTNQTDSFAEWQPMAAEFGDAALLGSVLAFAKSAAVVGPKAKAAPKFSVWLRNRRFMSFITQAARPYDAWPGPLEVWTAVAAVKGDPWTMSYLGKCAYRDGALVTASTTIFRGLRQEVGRELDDLGIPLVQEAAA